ncbi:hypothetical protein QAD02_024228 [Eretmocerus hayati]|uniref:Uncharacterized protein n=1 Tax=Eretmocerus hayati TaxID=131215 RepID=A0ACC2PY60_9HYME|nr:hypothetical protein QAD02_024228 [Eretmocerus hayati]
MSFFGWGKEEQAPTTDHPGRNLQDGLFQIASQACHILVQVNNTHNVSYGGSNSVTNLAYARTIVGEGSGVLSPTAGLGGIATSPGAPTSSSSPSSPGVGIGCSLGSATSGAYPKNVDASRLSKDQDVLVLLPQGKSRTPRVRHKLATVSENARLEVNSPTGDDDFDFWDQTGFMLRSDVDDPFDHGRWGQQDWCRPSYIPISIILVLIVLVVLLPLLNDNSADMKSSPYGRVPGNDSEIFCMSDCDISLVESIPLGLVYPDGSPMHRSTDEVWLDLIASSRESIEIGSLYWTMTREDVVPDGSAKPGEEVFQALLEAGRDRHITIKIAQNAPSQISPNIDTEFLTKKANAQVRSLNFAALLGGGVLHTKLWLIDRKHVYVGSANMDWRSLTQVKELGIVAYNCCCIAHDLAKIFDVYWTIGGTNKVPQVWPKALTTKINVNHPMTFTMDGNKYRSFFGSSPPAFSPEGRTNDIDGLLYCIQKAEKYIHISVMDYFPATIYSPKIKYWPIIDDALKAAAIERKVSVKLLISKWKHSRQSEDYFLKSLEDLSNSYAKVNIEVRRFVVPMNASQEKIPFSRVNHNKYMVTDMAAYIGTSNWSGDYFINTAGIGMVFEDADGKNNNSLREQLEAVFQRDWTSQYSHPSNVSFEVLKSPSPELGRSPMRSAHVLT